MQTWEYRKFAATGNNVESMDNESLGGAARTTDIEQLKTQGERGWELVAVTQNQSSGVTTFFMKRSKS
jgi:hypothetical protein